MKPIIGIIMGSDSDLSVMSEAAVVMEEFKIAYELTIVSAHRTPERAFKYAQTAQKRGLKIIIAGAGGAAHLAGVMAGLTPLPVIGVPMLAKSTGGLDSLLSTVQMPPGIPVATVAINGARNAGLLAAKILALSDKKISKQLEAFGEKLKTGVEEKAKKLEKLGYKKYLEGKS